VNPAGGEGMKETIIALKGTRKQILERMALRCRRLGNRRIAELAMNKAEIAEGK